jgi:Lantibiotic dehydratase, N terminus
MLSEPPAETAHLIRLDSGWSAWRTCALRGAGLPFDWLAGFADPSDMDGDAQSAAVRQLLREDLFLEALTWQNPGAVGSWVAKHATGIRSGTELRRSGYRQVVLARYAQRYCAKNDTIGFFGPVAWASLDDSEVGLHQFGTGGLRGGSTHFETWALEAIADAWAADERIAPHIPLRPHPAVSVEGDRLRRPWRPERPITPIGRALLTAARGGLDRTTLVRTVAARCERPVAEVTAELDGLCAAGVLLAGFVIPVDEQPEVRLRAQIRGIADDAVRTELTDRLDNLEQLRQQLSAAAGDPDAVGAILARLTDTVADLAGRPAHRDKQENVRGRTPVYQDCRRDIDVVVGSDLLDRLRVPLAVVVHTAAWLAAETADAVDRELYSLYLELRDQRADVRLSELYFSAAKILSGAPGTVVHEVVKDFQLRWAEVLACASLSGDETELRLSAADIGPLVTAVFPRRAPAWSGARYHSPDVLLARQGSAARWVLGELHVGLNTLESRLFHTQAEHRAELASAVAADMAGGRVVALLPNDSPEVSPRTYPPLAVHVAGKYVYWSFGRDSGAPGDSVSWPASALLVSPDRGHLTVQPPDGSWRASLFEVLGEFLSALVVDRFQIRPAARHLGRIVLDDLVVSRESWRFPARELPGEAERIGELTQSLHRAGVPRHIFARTPAERKPCYVDLEAPLLVRNLVRMTRLAQALPASEAYVDIVEMSPRPEELWLADKSDRRYTSEFRLVVVDDLTAAPVYTEQL